MHELLSHQLSKKVYLLSTYKNKFPTGIGWEWKLDGKVFKKKLMTRKAISSISLEWLDWMSNDSRFFDSQGETCTIVNGWNFGEKKIGPYYLDGYVRVDDHHYVLEFHGCRFHFCNRCKISVNGTKVCFSLNIIFYIGFKSRMTKN
jgi:hypothetical protein